MTSYVKKFFLARPQGYIALFLLLILIVGIFSASYFAGFVFLLGGILSWPIKIFFQFIKKKWKRAYWKWVGWALLWIFYTLLLLFISLNTPSAIILPPIGMVYKATIEQEDQSLEVFKVKEEITTNCSWGLCLDPNGEPIEIDEDTIFHLPERKIASKSRGLLVRELQISPLEVDITGRVSLTLPDGTSLEGELCKMYCPDSRIELLDFPKDSFYVAREARDLEVFPYVETETITWSVRDLERGIAFAYVRPPYYHLRPLLKPFVEFSSFGQWIVGLVGVIITLVITPVVKPVLTDLAKNRFKVQLEKKPAKKEIIIVSSKGEEKEIGIDE